MRPQSAKSKGRRLQQLVCRALLDAFPAMLTEDDVRSTSMGAGGEDVLLSPRAQELIPFSFEAKCCERLNVWSALEQARSNCPSHRTPCVVIKKNRTDAHAVLPLDVFVRLLSAQSHATPHAGPMAASTSSHRQLLSHIRKLIDDAIVAHDASAAPADAA